MADIIKPAEAVGDSTIDRSEIFTLAWPAIGEMCLHMLAWIVDTAMVGRLGAAALSAVGFGAQIYMSLAFFVGAVGIGITALVARCRGAGDLQQAGHIARQGLLLALILGGAVTVIVVPNAHRIYGVVGFPEDVRTLGVQYLRIVSLGGMFFLPKMAANGIMRGLGDTRTPLYVTIATNVVNIAGDYLLIFGNLGFPRMGVGGAAVAMVLGQAVGCTVAMAALLRRNDIQIRVAQGLRLHGQTLRRILSLSVPAGVETLLRDGARTINVMIIASMGTVAMAAHQVTITAESLSFMPGYGFAVAASILTGQSLGARKAERAADATRKSWHLAMMVMGGMGVVFLLFPTHLVRIFTDDPEVIELAAVCLRVAALMQIPMATADVYTGSLRGAGDTRTAMYISGLGSWLIRIPLVLLAVYVLDLSLVGVWVVVLIEQVIRAAAVRYIFSLGRWKTLMI